jgi:quinoprotein glucose dehydrogenase
VWAGGSYDPETHNVYVYSRRQAGSLGLIKPDPGKNDMNYISGSALTRARAAVPMGAAPGTAAATVATGANASEGGANAAAGRGGAGGGGGGGEGGGGGLNVQGLPIVKPPYGSISAISSARHHRHARDQNARDCRRSTNQDGRGPSTGALLRAYDKATGKDAGTVFMPAQQSGSPMTYMLNGKQYFIVAIGGGNYAGELLAFRLPN